MSSYHIVNYISFFVEFFQEQISILWLLVKYRSFKDELMHVRITNRLSENQKSHINWTPTSVANIVFSITFCDERV